MSKSDISIPSLDNLTSVASPLTASAFHPFSVGAMLDKYELAHEIGRGGMASVWVARRGGKHSFEKYFAIKTILPEHASKSEYRSMFLDEANLTSHFSHPNLVQVIELGDHGGVPYLVMEWVEGDSLSRLYQATLAQNATFPIGIALRILADACAGLHSAHELCGKDSVPFRLVHRDVSPQNILVGVSGSSKVIDFGLAKSPSRMFVDSNAKSIKGKLHYMAPEQAKGEEIDRRADIWAIGAILYHLVQGHPPYQADSDVDLLRLITSAQSPSTLGAHVPDPVRVILHRALSTDPEGRFATAKELQHALEQAMTDLNVKTTEEDVSQLVWKFLGSRLRAQRSQIAKAKLANVRERESIPQFGGMRELESGNFSSTEHQIPLDLPSGLVSSVSDDKDDLLAQPKSEKWKKRPSKFVGLLLVAAAVFGIVASARQSTPTAQSTHAASSVASVIQLPYASTSTPLTELTPARRKALQGGLDQVTIMLYRRPQCTDCDATAAWLQANRFPFADVPRAAPEQGIVSKVLKGEPALPVILNIDGTVIQGFDPLRIERLIAYSAIQRMQSK